MRTWPARIRWQCELQMRKIAEGQVYLCTWKKVGDKFHLCRFLVPMHAKKRKGFHKPRLHRKRRNTCDALDCAGKAQRRRRFGSTSDGCGNAEFMLALFAEPKAAWRFASRRTLQDAGAFATVARTSAMLWSARPQQAPFSGVSTNEGAYQILIFRTHCWLASQYVRFILISGSSPEGCTRPSASSARDTSV